MRVALTLGHAAQLGLGFLHVGVLATQMHVSDSRLRSAPGPPRLSIVHQGINDSLSFSV